jgi:DNA-binding NtrC family response regulator
LFVDDELAIVKMMEQMLSFLNYSVVAMTDSKAALDTFRNDPAAFDLVITDMTIPGLTGDRLIGEIRRIRKSIPVILCSGYNEKINAENAQRTGAGTFMIKPFEMEILAHTIRDVLDRKSDFRCSNLHS